ncbi:MAG: FAD-binding oxidoreductase [Rhizomicrobium sp.]
MSPRTFDIAVIGAGIAGASVAAELARTHRVIVLERESIPGYHSTGRSAALFSEIYGNAVVRALSRASRAFFYSPPDDFAQSALVRPRGSLYVARGEQMRKLESFADNRDIANSIRRIAPAEALRLCPILRPDYVNGAVLEPDAADVDVDALHQGYLRRFRAAGGTLALNGDVQNLEYRDGRWHIGAGDETIVCSTVINAAGAWATAVAASAGATPYKIQPCRRTAVLVELPAGMSANDWPMVIDIEESFYLKPDAGLLLISPADETPVTACDVQPEEFDIAVAIDRIERATTLKIARVRKRWAGLRSFAPDRSPIIGFDPELPAFFWLAGQGGYGIQTAPAAARLAATLVRGEAIPPELAGVSVADLSPARFGVRQSATRALESER